MTLDLLRSDELVNVLHGDDGGLSVEVEDQELLALLVSELLSPLDGILLSDIEEPVFEEDDDFSYFVCYLKNKCVYLRQKIAEEITTAPMGLDPGFSILLFFALY